MLSNRKTIKVTASFLLLTFLHSLIFPTAALALTGGPSQPEVQSFEPIGTNQMVDPFTGDFTYNITLIDVGGYPINMSYHSGITMDQEASWVGLGWNINPGVINRNLRGLPDDFRGDQVKSEFNMKKNQTFGLSTNIGLEIFGLDSKKFGGGISFGLGVNYNTYNGVGVDLMAGVSPSIEIGKSGQEVGTAGLGLSMRSSSNDGLTVSPSLSFSTKMSKRISGLGFDRFSSNVGTSINSRAGMTSMSYGIKADASFRKFTPGPVSFFPMLGGSSGGPGFSASLGSSISFVPNTYVPQQKFPFESGNYSASFKAGGEIFGLTGTFDITGYYTYQKLMEHSRSAQAYGYMYAENAVGDDKAMLDFNREKDRAFTRHTPNLPLTNFTYDLFGISGQGIGGMFRSHRSDVGYVHDPKVNNTSASFNLGIEVGGGNLVKFGADGSLNSTVSHTGLWENNNNALGRQFAGGQEGDLYEPSYFKMVGEKNITPAYWKNTLSGNEAVQLGLTGDDYNVKASNQLYLKSKLPAATVSQVKLPERAKRNQLISTLTKGEVRVGMGLNDYTSYHGQDHHIGEVTVLRTDGSRYVYGVPAYNYMQKSATFNVSGNGKDCNKGYVSYTQSDASKSNSKGKDNFYQSTTTPPYAHSYLLTALLSSDYSDFDGIKGPSDGDVGTFVKFEYDKIPTYKWRVPYDRFKASYDEGLQSSANDDMGSYQYGEKELFYLKKVESKTHVAIFHTSPREDGYGVQDEDGGKGAASAAMHKLDSISLYSRAEFLSNYGSLTQSVPIKRVHFEYDYSLCPNVPNNSGNSVIVNSVDINSAKGKLTLKKVYFTYGKSYKAKFSAYNFAYADLNHNGSDDDNANPDYNLKAYDRWGHYKPNSGNCGISDPITNPEYPYVDQDTANTNRYAASWNLTDIKLPSGGKIEVDYESDDYAYVQDKRAMQMFKVLGCGSSATDFNPSSASNILYNGKTPKEYLFFELQEPESESTYTADSLRNDYFEDILTSGGKLYFRFLMNLNDTWADGNFDYISGYTDVVQVGLFTGNDGDASNYKYGYIKLPKVKKGDKGSSANDANPISRSAWNFARTHNPELAYSSGKAHVKTNPSDVDAEDVFYELVDVFNNFGDFFKGPNGALRSDDYGRKFHKGKSWVRLYNPNYKKLGGGVRVKRLVMKDQWSQMTSSQSTSKYGQVYDYTLEDGTSSGVAAYEPLGGGDENPFRQPVSFSEERLLAPDDKHYIEKPFGESFFPAPSVGYSRVTVKNLQYANVTQHATGKVVQEFYTAKDFPTFTDQTNLKVKHKPANFLSKMLKFSVREHMNTSQGYVVETNDMHGKPKAKWVYAENETSYLSGVEYKYKTKKVPAALPFKTASTNSKIPDREVIDSEVPVLFKNNTVGTHEIGVDYDVVNDFRESYTKSQSGGLNFNLSTFLALIIPIAIPTVIPSYSKSINQYRSAVTTKVVNRFAIPTATIVYDNNSIIKTENLLWDAETGEVLLTKVEDQYNEPVYDYTYPAHFAYDGMEAASQNIGYEEEVTINSQGLFKTTLAPQTSPFRAGDEVSVNYMGQFCKAWVLEEIDGDFIKQYLIDKLGRLITNSSFISMTTPADARVKVIRSGYRNQMSTPVGKLTMKKNPVQSNAINVTKTGSYNPEIISASATEFSEKWQAPSPPLGEAGDVYDLYTKCDTFNPDITDQVASSFTNFLKAMAQNDRLEVDPQLFNKLAPVQTGQQTFILSGETSGTPLTMSDINVLNNALPKPISGDVYVTLYQEIINVLQWTHFYTSQATIVGWEIKPQRFIRFNFHNLNLSKVNHGWIAIDDPLGSVTYTDSEFESIDGIDDTKLSFPGSLPWLGCAGDPFIQDDQTNAYIDDYFLPFIVGECGPDLRCPANPYITQPVGINSNPYVLGLRGNWRPKHNYAYVADRDYTGTTAVLRDDATYSDFVPFWSTTGGNNDWQPNTTSINTDEQWTRASTISKYDEFGNEVENIDALGNYSSALFEFNGTMPIAVANNAQFGQTAYESFENYGSLVFRCKNIYDYFSIKPEVDDGIYTLSKYEAHSGYYSLEILAGDTVTYTSEFNTIPCTPAPDDIPYTYKACDELGVFGQYADGVEGYTYKVSYWVKGNFNPMVFEYPADVELEIEGIGGSNPIIASKTRRGDIIEGWQKIEQYYTVPASHSGAVDFHFKNNGSVKYYLDDLRIHPVNSSMKSYAYNPGTLRLMAELDENNYATFYEYDEEGILIRVKKETERGIETIQESRNHLVR